jgi:hypothetical protein
MLILMTAALAAAVPAVQPTAGEDAHGQHLAMVHKGHGQMKCCKCCNDMAKEHEGHAEHPGHQAH